MDTSENAPPKVDYRLLTVAGLRAELRQRELNAEGVKKELITRLEESDAAREDELLEGDGELEGEEGLDTDVLDADADAETEVVKESQKVQENGAKDTETEPVKETEAENLHAEDKEEEGNQQPPENPEKEDDTAAVEAAEETETPAQEVGDSENAEEKEDLEDKTDENEAGDAVVDLDEGEADDKQDDSRNDEDGDAQLDGSRNDEDGDAQLDDSRNDAEGAGDDDDDDVEITGAEGVDDAEREASDAEEEHEEHEEQTEETAEEEQPLDESMNDGNEEEQHHDDEGGDDDVIIIDDDSQPSCAKRDADMDSENDEDESGNWKRQKTVNGKKARRSAAMTSPEKRDKEENMDTEKAEEENHGFVAAVNPPEQRNIVDDLFRMEQQLVANIHPLNLQDLSHPSLLSEIEICNQFNVSFYKNKNNDWKGVIKMLYEKPADCQNALETLSIRENLKVKGYITVKEKDAIIDGLTEGKPQPSSSDKKQALADKVKRSLYVWPLPADVRYAEVEKLFPDAKEVCIPATTAFKDNKGHAYVIYDSEEEAKKAALKFIDIQPMLEVREKPCAAVTCNADKTDPLNMVLRTERRNYHLEMFEKQRDDLQNTDIVKNKDVANQKRLCRNNFKLLILDEDARRGLGLPLFEPRMSTLVPDLAKEVFAPFKQGKGPPVKMNLKEFKIHIAQNLKNQVSTASDKKDDSSKRASGRETHAQHKPGVRRDKPPPTSGIKSLLTMKTSEVKSSTGKSSMGSGQRGRSPQGAGAGGTGNNRSRNNRSRQRNRSDDMNRSVSGDRMGHPNPGKGILGKPPPGLTVTIRNQPKKQQIKMGGGHLGGSANQGPGNKALQAAANQGAANKALQAQVAQLQLQHALRQQQAQQEEMQRKLVQQQEQLKQQQQQQLVLMQQRQQQQEQQLQRQQEEKRLKEQQMVKRSVLQSQEYSTRERRSADYGSSWSREEELERASRDYGGAGEYGARESREGDMIRREFVVRDEKLGGGDSSRGGRALPGRLEQYDTDMSSMARTAVASSMRSRELPERGYSGSREYGGQSVVRRAEPQGFGGEQDTDYSNSPQYSVRNKFDEERELRRTYVREGVSSKDRMDELYGAREEYPTQRRTTTTLKAASMGSHGYGVVENRTGYRDTTNKPALLGAAPHRASGAPQRGATGSYMGSSMGRGLTSSMHGSSSGYTTSPRVAGTGILGNAPQQGYYSGRYDAGMPQKRKSEEDPYYADEKRRREPEYGITWN